MPARWVYRLGRLNHALENYTFIFANSLLAAGLEYQTRISSDIIKFLKLFIDHVTPVAQKWLSFPLVLYGLGDPDRSNACQIAVAVLRSKAGEQAGTTMLTKHIKGSDRERHPLLDSRSLCTGIRTVASSRMDKCAPLQLWFDQHVNCLPHNNLLVETNFSHAGNIHKKGKRLSAGRSS